MGGYIDQSAGLDPAGSGITINLGYPISGGPTLADFVVPLEAAPGVDLGGGGGGTTAYIDPLAGAGGVGYVDPALTAPAPTVDPTTGSMPVLDPTLASAIGLNPTGPAPLTSIAANAPQVYGIDPTSGLPQTTFTDVVTSIGPGSAFDPSLLPSLPPSTTSTTGIFASPAPLPSYTPPATPTQLSVFDPSLLPVLPTATTTPYGGILAPVAPPAAPGGSSLLSKLGNAISKALGATTGGSGGAGSPSASKPATPSTAGKPTQASMVPGAGGSNLMTLLLIGLVAYVVLKEGKK